MPLIKKSVKEKVSNHEQSEAIEKGARAFTKSLLAATKQAEKIEAHNHKKTETKSKLSESKTIKAPEKLISREMETLIKKSGYGAEISEILILCEQMASGFSASNLPFGSKPFRLKPISNRVFDAGLRIINCFFLFKLT